MSRARFRGQRLGIAIALRDRKRTLYEVSRAMGRRPGDIQRTLRQMHAEGLLSSSDPEPVRGTLFWFNEDHAAALEAALEEDTPPGQLAPGQRLLSVAAPPHVDPYAVLGRRDLNGPIGWVAEWGGDGEFLVGMVKNAEKAAVDGLVAALREKGIECVQRRAGEVMDGAGLRRLVAAIDETSTESVGA